MGATEASLVLCQVVFQVEFHPDYMAFSLPVPTDSAVGTAPSAGAGTALAYHALTKTASPDSSMPTAVRSDKNNSNYARPTEGTDVTPKLTSDP